MKAPVVIVALLLVLGIAGAMSSGLFGVGSPLSMPASLQFSGSGARTEQEQTPTESAKFLNTSPVSGDKKRLQHPTYGFTVTVPNAMELERYEEGGNSETLVFFDTNDGIEFQLFVTPYDASEVTKERLALDIPSGDIREPQEIVLGNGLRAFMFLSHAPIVGDTREVWFIHDGYLYEATVAYELDSWLAEILNTITFTQ